MDFDTKTDPNNDFILAQSRETQAASQLPSDVTNYRDHGTKIGDGPPYVDRRLLSARNL